MNKLHYYVCQTDRLLAKYVKIAEVDSGHILELDKSMENMRFMRNMNDQYTNESDHEDDSNDDVEDIDIRSAKQDDNYGASNIVLPCPRS